MSDDIEYDPDELAKLVAEALGTINSSESRSLFSYGDSQMLPRLYEILPRYVQHHGDVQVILDELRDQILNGMVGQQNRAKSLRSLHTVVRNCRRCPFVVEDPQLPRWNLNDPDVVFITDMPLRGSGGDKFLIDTLKKTGFSSSQIAVTSVTRCFPEQNRGPNPEEVSNCTTRFLFDELQLLRPKLIVAVGGLVASVMLGDQVKVTQERGRIFWVGPWAIMVTLAPGYAVRNARTQEDFESDIAQAHTFAYGKV